MAQRLHAYQWLLLKKKNYIKKIYNRKLRQNKKSSVATLFSKPWAVKYFYFY